MSSSPSRHLVFDVGGTQLRAALCAGEDGAVLEVAKVDAPSFQRHPGASWPELQAHLVAAMSDLRARLDRTGKVASAVVAFPGPVDGARRVLAAPTLWGAMGPYPYPLEDDLRAAWPDTEVRVMNDVTAAAFRYMRSEDDEFCVVAVSTGIGNKVFVGGRPLVGPSGQGGEIGHFQVDSSPTAPPCDCGGRGHLGAIASGRATAARARRRAEGDAGFRGSLLSREGWTAETLTAEAVATAYRRGDAWSAAIVREGADALGLVLASIYLAIGVDRFVFIGGFALGLGSGFCDDVRAAISARSWQGSPATVSVTLGSDDGHCALVGGGRAKHLGLLP